MASGLYFPTDGTPVNPVRSDDFDALYGVQQDPNDDKWTQFAKGLQSALLRNSPQGQQVNAELMKAKINNQMQMQLEKQKLELKRQYPDYEIFHDMYGTTAVDKNNPNNVVNNSYSPDSDAARAANIKADLAAKTLQAKKDALLVQPDVMEAEKQHLLNQPKLDQSMMDNRALQEDYRRQLTENARLKAQQGPGQGVGMSPEMAKAAALQEVQNAHPEVRWGDANTNQRQFRNNPQLAQEFAAAYSKYFGSSRKVGNQGLLGSSGGAPQAAPQIPEGFFDLSSDFNVSPQVNQ